MDIKLVPDANTNPKSTYVIIVPTMTGDGDDEHEFEIKTESDEELKDILIGLEILMNANSDTYCGEFFEQYIKDELCYDSNYDTYDEICPFKVKYYDENGNKFSVDYTPDDDMTQKIKSFHGLTQKEITQMRLGK